MATSTCSQKTVYPTFYGDKKLQGLFQELFTVDFHTVELKIVAEKYVLIIDGSLIFINAELY